MFWIIRAYQLSVHPTLDHRPLPSIIENMHLRKQKANVTHAFKQTSIKTKHALMSVTIFAGILMV